MTEPKRYTRAPDYDKGPISDAERVVDLRRALDQRDEARAERDAALRERDRFREHSVTLNTVSWRISQALGNVPEGATEVWGDTLPDLEALIRDRDEARGLTSVDDIGRVTWTTVDPASVPYRTEEPNP